MKPWTAGVFGADGVGFGKRIEVVGMGTDFDANAGIGIGISDGVVAGVVFRVEDPVVGVAVVAVAAVAAVVAVAGEPGASIC